MLRKSLIFIWIAVMSLLTGCISQERTIQVQQTESPSQVYADVAIETIEVQPSQWENKTKSGMIVSYEGFCGERLVVVQECEGGRQISFLDEAGSVPWISDVFPNISQVFLSEQNAVVEIKEGKDTCLYFVSVKGEKIAVDRFSTKEKVTNVSWTEDGKYFIYMIRQQGDFIGKVYDSETRQMKTYRLSDYLPRDFSWTLDEIAPYSIILAQDNYLAIQAIYHNDAYLISLRLSEPDGNVDFGNILVRKCSEEPIVSSQGVLYYIAANGQLNALRQDGSEERTIASNVNQVSVSGDNLAYTVRNSSIDQLYIAKKREETVPKLVDIRPNIKKLDFDYNGCQLMVQYTGRDEAQQEQCVVLKIED